MSGLKSRQKGMRREYEIRDLLRESGYIVDRIPASGASQGFKGDLRVKMPDHELLVEVKARKEGFEYIYSLMELVSPRALFSMGVLASYVAKDIFESDEIVEAATLSDTGKLDKFFERCREMRGPSDILVLKQDRKPAIFIRWYTKEAESRIVGTA